jgi:hypothetical protein
MHGRDEKCIKYFGWKAWKENATLKPKLRWEDSTEIGFRDISCRLDSAASRQDLWTR